MGMVVREINHKFKFIVYYTRLTKKEIRNIKKLYKNYKLYIYHKRKGLVAIPHLAGLFATTIRKVKQDIIELLESQSRI